MDIDQEKKIKQSCFRVIIFTFLFLFFFMHLNSDKMVQLQYHLVYTIPHL